MRRKLTKDWCQRLCLNLGVKFRNRKEQTLVFPFSQRSKKEQMPWPCSDLKWLKRLIFHLPQLRLPFLRLVTIMIRSKTSVRIMVLKMSTTMFRIPTQQKTIPNSCRSLSSSYRRPKLLLWIREADRRLDKTDSNYISVSSFLSHLMGLKDLNESVRSASLNEVSSRSQKELPSYQNSRSNFEMASL